MVLRLLTSADVAFLERMMLFAGFPPDRELPADAREMPHIRRFLHGWGRAGDVGVVAVMCENSIALFFQEIHQ